MLRKLQTLRWNSGDDVEVGFSPQEKSIRKANLCFDDGYLITRVSSNRQDDLSFVVDTGDYDASLFVPYATRFLDLVAAKGTQSFNEIIGYAGRRRLRELILPEIQLRVGGMETKLRPAHTLLERQPLFNDRCHGSLGIRILNQAQTVTIDFQAMCLTLDAKTK